MERLTHEADFGLEDWEETLFFVKSDPNGAYDILDIAKYQGNPEFDEILKHIALRLSSIENILGDDYDLDRLRELVEMDKANSVPPCQIGDVFYAIDWSRWGSEVKEYRISMLQQKRDKAWRIRAKDTQSHYQVDWAYDDYRERAYSTREAAEAALKARKQD